ncbi:MAG: DNA polymerase III subunit gamma/tau [Desulfobacter sp.]
MSYQVLALKYRPQTFEDVVGQEHVTTTLTNAIAADRVAHALLLTGPRGTGKTTIARILAKAMTCSQGPTPTPCNTCKLCTDIIQGHCADVFEIDGASNNSVEQIRDLRENVTYMPASARFKIYIIDEVHMLSVAAFNALLKTLEEPPDHVLFVFATTEVHKIPATILSRCQRHDLARIPLNRISDHLENLCQKEGFSVDRESLDHIALEADGSIRDALSLLDRVLSASAGREISRDAVIESLGVMDRRLMFDISSGVFSKDGACLIHIIEKVNDSGLDLKKFYSDIIFHFRNLNIIKLCGKDTSALNLIETEKEALFQSVSDIPQAYLGTLLRLLLDQETLVRFSSHTQTAVEMVLLRLIQVNPGAQLDAVITKLDLLARQIDAKLSNTSGIPVSPEAGIRVKEQIQKPSNPPESPPEHRDTNTAPAGNSAQAPPPVQEEPGASMQLPQAEHLPPPPEPPPAVQTPPQEPGQASWPDFLTILQKKLPFIFALFSKGRVINPPDQDQVVVELDSCSAFESSRLKNKDKELQELSRVHLGKSITVNINNAKAAPAGPSKEQKAEEQARQAASRHPMVQEARRLFDGEIII